MLPHSQDFRKFRNLENARGWRAGDSWHRPLELVPLAHSDVLRGVEGLLLGFLYLLRDSFWRCSVHRIRYGDLGDHRRQIQTDLIAADKARFANVVGVSAFNTADAHRAVHGLNRHHLIDRQRLR